MNIRKQIIDQGAHFLIGAAVLLPVALFPNALAFGVTGAALGVIREATEPDPILTFGSLLDITFWALGGFAVGLIAA